ncbi:MAG: hypothetical protein KJO49_09845 [Bacteroidia bacterium]|nr:hypothetical protein [Bacteroidia bacterium]
MKKANIFVILMLIPLMGIPQNDFNSGIRSNNRTSERFLFDDVLLADQAEFKLRYSDSLAINDSIKKTIFHYDFFIGTFIPTQKLELLGVKPAVGVSFGINSERMTYDLTLEMRFGKTKNSYELANLEMTNNYFGGYLGIDVMRDIWTGKKNQVLFFVGGGADLFEIEPGDYRDPNFVEYILFGEDQIQTKSSRNIFSHNFNFGLTFRFFNKKKNYYAIRYRYNMVDYNSNKIRTDVTGNYHSITLSFGGISKE